MRLCLLVLTVVVAMLHVAPSTAMYPPALPVYAPALWAAPALAIPPPPFSPYGTVLVDGVVVANGTIVSAWCGGVKYKETATQMSGGASWYYNLDIPGDDPDTPAKEGCSANETVTFRIGSLAGDGYIAAPNAPWTSTSFQLDLRAATATATPTRTATPSATPVYSPTPTRSTSTTPTRTPTKRPTATRTPTRTPTARAGAE